MRCTHCGADIPEGMLICPDCRNEVQMVPDYNPLEDVLVREVRGSVEDATRPIRTDDIRRYRSGAEQGTGNSTRVLSQGELERIRAERMGKTSAVRRGNTQGCRTQGEARRNTGNMRQSTDSLRQNTGNMRQSTGQMRPATGAVRQNGGGSGRDVEEKRRQQAARKKRAVKKRRRLVAGILLVLLVVLGGAGFVVYQNSYDGVVAKAYQAMQTGDYHTSEKLFQRAIRKDAKKAEAYTGISKLYIQQKKEDEAEEMFLTAIDSQPENAALYQAAIQFYVDTKQVEQISGMLSGCSDAVLSKVSAYVSDMPEFSLEEGDYTEVQEVTLTGDGKIYYTLDDSEPTTESIEYTEPILLEEGTTTIKTIAVNKKGIPSLTASRTYTIEIPIEDAPAVTPSTGQYSVPTQITIQVPEGYTAYYTTDGTTPSAASTPYTGPVDMPEGSTIFSAVLINDAGKMTQVTKRNYLLEYE